MATVVYQQSLIQSCIDQSQILESRTLTLRLSSPKPDFSNSLDCLDRKPNNKESNTTKEIISNNNKTLTPEMGVWSFLQSLSNTTSQGLQESSYVHPLVKRSTSRLNEKSLQMCTESLGSETGSDNVAEDSILLFPLPNLTKTVNLPSREHQKIETFQNSRKLKNSEVKMVCRTGNVTSIPPPLTTMTGPESLHYRAHREEGRLVIKAVEVPKQRECFEAVRSNGRLRLYLVEDLPVVTVAREEACEPSSDTEVDIEGGRKTMRNTNQQLQGFDQELEVRHDGEMMRIEDMVQRSIRGRCHEAEIDNNGLMLNWREPFWVAIS